MDNVSEALLFGLDIEEDEKSQTVDFIIGQQGRFNAYAELFAPTDFDLKHDLILFTGEKIKSRVGKCHVIGEEASRTLHKLNLKSEKINKALEKADQSMLVMVNTLLKEPRYEYGMYCCKSCTCAFWINLASGGLGNDTDMLKAGMKYLGRFRDGKGKWKGFPYYYTLHVLNDMESTIAMNEMKYTAGSIEKRLNKKPVENTKYELRRNYICEQILEKVNRN